MSVEVLFSCSLEGRQKFNPVFRAVNFLANSQKFDGLAGDMADGKRRTTPGITIRLGEDDTGKWQRITKGFGGIGGILSGHGIHDKQGFHRIRHLVQGLDLIHHFFIDSQATRRIHKQHIYKLFLRFGNGIADNLLRLL